LQRTGIWKFKGGTGTYLRAETLPRLALSKVPGLRKVWIEIIDPGHLDACKAYSNYRRQMLSQYSTHDREDWSLRRVRIESYATIVAALWYTSHHNMTINLALSSTATSFRYDMSSEFIMVTNEHKASTALRTDINSNLYDRYNDELKLSFDQAREVDLTEATITHRFSGLDVLRALRDLTSVQSSDGFLTDTTCDEIAAKAISEAHAAALGQPRGGARNPYP
jgi:hypothetical protein